MRQDDYLYGSLLGVRSEHPTVTGSHPCTAYDLDQLFADKYKIQWLHNMELLSKRRRDRQNGKNEDHVTEALQREVDKLDVCSVQAYVRIAHPTYRLRV